MAKAERASTSHRARALTAAWRARLAVVLLGACAPPTAQTPRPDLSRLQVETYAAAEPCKYRGTSHKAARARIEELEACGAISIEQWRCLTDAAKAVDREWTAACDADPAFDGDLAERQRAAFAPCVAADRSAIASCAAFSSAPGCWTDWCRD
jgi:hypothetical protein